MENKVISNIQNERISISRFRRADGITDTITLLQAIADLGYKGPGENSEMEKRLKAGHTLETSLYKYHIKST